MDESNSIASVKELREGEAARIDVMREFDAKKERYVSDLAEWLRQNHREDAHPSDVSTQVAGEFSPGEWKAVALPGRVAEAPGVYWIRKVIDLTPEKATSNLEFKVMIGPMEGFEQVAWNGVKISETPYAKYPGAGYPLFLCSPIAIEERQE